MNILVLLGLATVLFLALPWLAVAFGRYCDAVNRLTARRGPAAGPCDQHPHAPVIGGMCGGCTVYPPDMR